MLDVKCNNRGEIARNDGRGGASTSPSPVVGSLPTSPGNPVPFTRGRRSRCFFGVSKSVIGSHPIACSSRLPHTNENISWLIQSRDITENLKRTPPQQLRCLGYRTERKDTKKASGRHNLNYIEPFSRLPRTLKRGKSMGASPSSALL